MAIFYRYVCSLKVVLLERWKLVMLNAGFDNNSGVAVGLSSGMVGMVEVITVYFQIIFVGEVSC